MSQCMLLSLESKKTMSTEYCLGLERLDLEAKSNESLAHAKQPRDNQEIKIANDCNKVVVFVHYDEFYSSNSKIIDRLFNDLRDKIPDLFSLEELLILKASQ